MSEGEKKEPKSIFEFHTCFEAQERGKNQKIMTCPFCEKEDHFYFNTLNNMWDCKVCFRSGNSHTFIREWYKEFENLVQTSHMLAEARGVPAQYFQKLGFKYNETNKSFMIPTIGKDGLISNLYKAFQIYDREQGKYIWRIMASPSISHQFFNVQETYQDILWVCEGHWDKPAADAIIASRPISAASVPGSGVWDSNWTKHLAGRDIVFCYDNDPSGKQGYERVITEFISKAPQKPKSISFIDWPTDLPEGFDLNDAYRKWGKGAYTQLEKMIKPYDSPQNMVVVHHTIETVHEDKSCDTFEKLMDVFKSVYYTTKDMEQGLAVVLASIYSIRVNGEQLWIRLIGPPGSGKTTIATTVSGSEQVVLKSTFTGLYSGWKDDSAEDASLVPQIAGKTLIVKDADALLKQPNVQQIFSELRDIYDKNASVQFKNRVRHDYRNIRISMVLCGTNVLRRADSSFLGERYLDFELRLTDDDREKVSDRAFENAKRAGSDESGVELEVPVIAAGKGFINHLYERPNKTSLDSRTEMYIKKLANLAVAMRTKVDRDMYGRGDITFAPVQESPTRLIGQFTKVCQVLPIIFETTVPDERTHGILFKLARDIIDVSSVRYRICQELCEGYFTMMQLVEMTGLSQSMVVRELDNIRSLNMVTERIATLPGQLGRKARAFTLTDKLKEALILSDQHQ